MTRRHHQTGNRDAHVVQTGYRHQSDPNATWARETPTLAERAAFILAGLLILSLTAALRVVLGIARLFTRKCP